MSRYRPGRAYSFKCWATSVYHGEYRIAWVVDHYYSGSRLRYPRQFTRDTDERGARAFCKRHGLTWLDTGGGATWAR